MTRLLVLLGLVGMILQLTLTDGQKAELVRGFLLAIMPSPCP